MEHRQARAADLDAITDTITGAFENDPAWTWVFPDPQVRAEHLPGLWRLFVEGALRYSSVWMTDRAEAVTVWLPPGGTELTDAQDVERRSRFLALPDDVRGRMDVLWDAFEAHRPTDRPHHFLSLFATNAAHRGHGYGMDLLRAGLDRIDVAGEHAYLESSNSANNTRYAAVGFHVIGAFSLPDGPTVTTMWRDARSPRA